MHFKKCFLYLLMLPLASWFEVFDEYKTDAFLFCLQSIEQIFTKMSLLNF
jgi:hypothetical protein